MNLQDLSLVAQVIGVLLIPASLLFVGLQMRQTRVVERANAQRDLLSQCQVWTSLLIHDAGMFADVRDCLHDYDGQSPFKQNRFSGWAFHLLFICEQSYYQRRDRLINEQSFQGNVAVMLALLQTPGGRQWWLEAQKLVGRDIGTYLARRLAGGAENLPPPLYQLVSPLRAPEAETAAPIPLNRKANQKA